VTRRRSVETTADADRIEAFVRIVSAIAGRRAVRDGFKASFSITADQGGELAMKHAGPDPEDYRSLLLDLRKLIAQHSNTHFPKVMRSAASMFRDDEACARFEELRQEWNTALSTGPVELQMNETPVKPEELLHVWLNGEVFHDDATKRERWHEIVGFAGGMAGFIVQNTLIVLMQIAFSAWAEIDSRQGGSGVVTIGSSPVQLQA
jgi:hypothetical protein